MATRKEYLLTLKSRITETYSVHTEKVEMYAGGCMINRYTGLIVPHKTDVITMPG